MKARPRTGDRFGANLEKIMIGAREEAPISLADRADRCIRRKFEKS